MTVVAEERSGAPPYNAYAAIVGVFVGGLGVAGAAARLLGRNPACQTPLDLVVLSAASFKAARTLAHDEVTSFLREPFVQGAAHEGDEEPLESGDFRQAIGEKARCSSRGGAAPKTSHSGDDGQTPFFRVSHRPAARGPADASHRPSPLKATSVTAPLWICRSATRVPERVSQTRTAVSSLAVASNLPSGLKASALTAPSWGSSTDLPVAASQMRAVRSSAAVATCLPFGENAAARTSSLCPR